MKGTIDQEGLKALMALGLKRGYVTHDDIRECVPECAQSDHLLIEVTRLLDETNTADVFMMKPSEEQRKRGRIAMENEAFKRGVDAAFSAD